MSLHLWFQKVCAMALTMGLLVSCSDEPVTNDPFGLFDDASTADGQTAADTAEEDTGDDTRSDPDTTDEDAQEDLVDVPDVLPVDAEDDGDVIVDLDGADVVADIEDLDSEVLEDVDGGDDVTDVVDVVDVPDIDDADTADIDAADVTDTVDLEDIDVSDGDADIADLDLSDADADADTGDVDGDGTSSPACALWNSIPNATLRQELEDYVTEPHDWPSGDCYREARNHMYGVDGLDPIDVFDGNYECQYTGRLVSYSPATASRTPGGFNTEHSWPRSDGAESTPAECDIHHLFPTDASTNSSRGSLEFGETFCGPPTGGMCDCCEGGSEVGTSSDSRNENVFQVRQARRGDIARAHFYFSVRYDMAIDPEEETVLRAWHAQDPVVGSGESTPSREQIRNDRIEAVQGNRNPFVDCPDLVDRIANF